MQSASDVISSLFWFKDEGNICDDDEPQVIEQFVQHVEDFSSQYGSEISVSYTAFNIRGPPSNFPDYGDYPQAFVMRTYGTWWEEAPSAPQQYMPQNSPNISSQDFLEVSFEREVYPLEVSIFETYNPGAVVRVWALCVSGWVLLWEGAPACVGDTPRIFAPPIRQIRVPTRTLRLEFNHRLLPYYTELDAILLKGTEPRTELRLKDDISYSSLFFDKRTRPVVERGEILSRILASNLQQSVTSRRPPLAPAAPAAPPAPPAAPLRPLGDLQRLPDETILSILQHLDLQSLCRCARVSRELRRLATDAILYRGVDLRPQWHCVTSQVLSTLSARCELLQRLDLSWCGSHGALSTHSVIKFVLAVCSELTHVRMDCCRFVDTSVLRALAATCPHLQEVSLRSVPGGLEWSALSALRHLRRLDLYRTDISTQAAVDIVRASTRLQHINLGSCKMITSMDEVAAALGAHCPGLLSVDMWKSYSLSGSGLRALGGGCALLQELEVGWCVQAGGSGAWLAALHGADLRRLCLGALRGVCDRDLRDLVPRAPRLQQLDLLGVRPLTPRACDTILAECHELRLLDVSFCDQILDSQVSAWRAQYPHVSIKRSFQSARLHAPPAALHLAH